MKGHSDLLSTHQWLFADDIFNLTWPHKKGAVKLWQQLGYIVFVLERCNISKFLLKIYPYTITSDVLSKKTLRFLSAIHAIRFDVSQLAYCQVT